MERQDDPIVDHLDDILSAIEWARHSIDDIEDQVVSFKDLVIQVQNELPMKVEIDGEE